MKPSTIKNIMQITLVAIISLIVSNKYGYISIEHWAVMLSVLGLMLIK